MYDKVLGTLDSLCCYEEYWGVLFVCLFNLVGHLTELSLQSCHSFSGLQLTFPFGSFRLCWPTWHLSYTGIGSGVNQIFGQSLYSESGVPLSSSLFPEFLPSFSLKVP